MKVEGGVRERNIPACTFVDGNYTMYDITYVRLSKRGGGRERERERERNRYDIILRIDLLSL